MKYKYICKIWKEAMKHTAPHKYKDYIGCPCKLQCRFKLDILKYEEEMRNKFSSFNYKKT